MAAVTKSWIETNCEQCGCRRVFLVGEGWVLACSVCGLQKKLGKTGIEKA